MFGLVCGSGIYTCLYVDKTLDVKINLSRDNSEIPGYALIILKVVRFMAGCYVMSALALFWSYAVCVMHMTGYSMLEYHGMQISSLTIILMAGRAGGRVGWTGFLDLSYLALLTPAPSV